LRGTRLAPTAALKDFRIHASTDEIAAAKVTEENWCLCCNRVTVFQAGRCRHDVQIEQCLNQFADQVALTTTTPPPPTGKTTGQRA